MNLRLTGLALSSALCMGTANAAILLAVDIHATGATTQAGFSGWIPSGSDLMTVSTTTIGIYTLTSVAGPTKAAFDGTTGILSKNTRNRTFFAPNGGLFTQADLMRDRMTAGGGAPSTLGAVNGTGNGLYMKVSGLAANTTYSLQVWGIDWLADQAKSGYNAIYDETDTLTSLGSYTIGTGVTTIADNNTYSVTGNITSDANGEIVFKSISNMDGSGIMNGFTVSDIPEPGSALLSLLGIAVLSGIRRRG